VLTFFFSSSDTDLLVSELLGMSLMSVTDSDSNLSNNSESV
jgi:hypothetical protein